MDIHDSRTGRLLFTVLLFAWFVPNGIAQSSNDDKVAAELGQAKNDVRSMKNSPGNPNGLDLLLDGAPSIGDANARVAVVEFGDYECPYCGRHANQVLPEIVANYVNTGKVRYFFKDTPVEAIHPAAFKAAEAALCAGEQGTYWEMHDLLFKNQQALGVTELAAHARALNLDMPKFQQCFDSDRYAAQIRKSLEEAVKAGARGTPTFIVAVWDPNEPGKTAVTTLSGFRPYRAFQQVLDRLLSPEGANEDQQ